MSLVEGLCTGSGQLQRSSIVTLTAMLKAAQMPPSVTVIQEQGNNNIGLLYSAQVRHAIH